MVYAISFHVNTLVDEDDGTSDPGIGTGTSLREAVDQANRTTGADTITFDAAVFTTGSRILLTLGQMDIIESLTITGLGSDIVIIDAQDSSRILFIDDGSGIPDLDVQLTGMTLTRGMASFSEYGGAILTHENLTIADMLIAGNDAYRGGGIYSDGSMTVTGSTFSENDGNKHGGGIFNIGTLTVTGSLFSNNRADGYLARGGGIFNQGTLTVTDSNFSGNYAENIGGGIVCGGSGAMTITGSTFVGNRSYVKGGAIGNMKRGDATIVGSTISGNTAGNGGGIYNLGNPTDGGFMTIHSSTITNNYANGIHNDVGTSGNTGAVTMYNTIVAGNIAYSGASGDIKEYTPSSVSGSNNLIGDADSAGGLIHGIDGNIVGNAGVGTIDISTVLYTILADNGGPTWTHALMSGSPAVDAGSNALLPADVDDLDGDSDTSEPIPFDQRGVGFDRILGGTVDIGAFESGNQMPTITPIADQVILEDATTGALAFTIGDTETDVSLLTVTASSSDQALIPDANLVLGGSGANRTITVTPAANRHGGPVTITLSVFDGSNTTEAGFDVTITGDNDAPTLTDIGDKTVEEDVELTFTVTASDSDDDPANNLTLSVDGLPSGASFTPASGLFTWTPTELQRGSFEVTFTVTDDGTPSLSDSETITITVNQANAAPVLAVIDDKTVDEEATLAFTVAASDPDDDPVNNLTLSVDALPAGAGFDAATGAFNWTPTESQQGSYEVTFTVTDDGTPNMSDSETITITVNEVNDAPVLAAIGDKTADEEFELSFTVTAIDADLPANGLTYSLSGSVPTGAAIDPDTGFFSWTPSESQGPGSYTFDVVVTDDGIEPLSASETITVTVNDVNETPVIDTIGNKIVNEEETLSFTVSAIDPDIPANGLIYSLSGSVPTGAAIDPDTGEFSWAPTEDQGPGSYTFDVVVTEDDVSALAASETITITVTEVNATPLLDAIGNKTVNEGQMLSFTASATDPDLPANDLTYSLSGSVPTGAAIDPDTGEFSWTPSESQGPGTYTFDVLVTDNGAAPQNAGETITITVNELNEAPILAATGNQTVNEETMLSFTVTAADPNDDPANNLTLSVSGLPTGAAFDPDTGEFTWTPTEYQQGDYDVTFTVTDHGDPELTVSETITITVNELNDVPILALIGDKTVDEGNELRFNVTAYDPNDNPLNNLTLSASGLPTGAGFDPATGVFTWTPSGSQQGSYDVTFTVTDDGEPNESASETITITVNEVNESPIVDAGGPYSIEEGDDLVLSGSATDHDIPIQTLTYSWDLNNDGTFGDATGAAPTISWADLQTLGLNDDGSYTVTLRVSDDDTSTDATATLTITNTAPAADAGGPYTIAEGESLVLAGSGSDVSAADTAILTYSWDLNNDGTFGDATGAAPSVDWATLQALGLNDDGSYTVTLRVVDDDTFTDAASILTITNVAPTADAGGPYTIAEGESLVLAGSGSDVSTADAVILTYSWDLNNDGTFGDATGAAPTVSWADLQALGLDDDGSYTVTLRVSDDDTSTDATSTLTITNTAPAVDAGGPYTIAEGESLVLAGSGSDVSAADAAILTYSWDLNNDGTFGDATGAAPTVSWAALEALGVDDDDIYTVTLRVSDDDTFTNAVSTLTVENSVPDVTADIPIQTVQYSDAIDPVTISATDIAADTMNASVSWSDGGAFQPGLPDALTIAGGLTFQGDVDQVGTGTWTISGMADLDPSRDYTLRVTVTDEDGGSTTEDIVLLVDQENARSTYAGQYFVSTPSIRSSEATIELRATVVDITTAVDSSHAEWDGFAGDISNARVTFVDAAGIPIAPDAAGLPVTLVDPADPSTAVAAYSWAVDIGNQDSISYDVGIRVEGFYERFEATDLTVVTVSKPQDNSVTGGGYLVNTDSAGLYAGDDDLRTNFGFNIKFNKKRTNVQGKVNVILRQEDRVYQIKSNATDTLLLDPDDDTRAEFRAKANLTDITDPANPVSLGGNLTFIASVTDAGEPGSEDRIGLTLWRNDELWFSSHWSGTSTLEQLLDGGNVQVKSGNSLQAAGGALEGAVAEELGPEALLPIVDEAIIRWQAAGLGADELAALGNIEVSIADLPDGTLGFTSSNRIRIDSDAAGHGWFVDPTPAEDSEFLLPGDQDEQGRMDLLTAVMHEFGHVLGLDDLDPLGHDHGLMAAALPTGVRKLPAADVPLPGSPEVGSALPVPLIDWSPQAVIEMGQRAEGIGQRTEDRGHRAEGRGHRAEGRDQRAEDR